MYRENEQAFTYFGYSEQCRVTILIIDTKNQNCLVQPDEPDSIMVWRKLSELSPLLPRDSIHNLRMYFRKLNAKK